MSWYFILKCVVSGILVGVVSEIAKRSPAVAAVTASLPLVSILALIWLYQENREVDQVIALSNGIALVVLPSLAFFIVLSLLLRFGVNFYGSLSLSCTAMAAIYWLYVAFLKHVGITL